jgi:hypothetical protein
MFTRVVKDLKRKYDNTVYKAGDVIELEDGELFEVEYGEYVELEEGEIVDDGSISNSSDRMVFPKHDMASTIPKHSDRLVVSNAGTKANLNIRIESGVIVVSDAVVSDAEVKRQEWIKKHGITYENRGATRFNREQPVVWIEEEYNRCRKCDGTVVLDFGYCNGCLMQYYSRAYNWRSRTNGIVYWSHMREKYCNDGERYDSIHTAIMEMFDRDDRYFKYVTAARICGVLAHALVDRTESRHGDKFWNHFYTMEQMVIYFIGDANAVITLEGDSKLEIKTAYNTCSIVLDVDDKVQWENDRLLRLTMDGLDNLRKSKKVYTNNGGKVVAPYRYEEEIFGVRI